MLCIAPYKTGKEEFGCGKCLPCKFAKRRVWVGRVMLELHCHRHSCFVTLTYKEAPDGFSEEDVRLFFKRLRRRRGAVRYLLVGEKGSKGGRVHYHVALFGVSVTERANIDKCWGLGFVDVGELNAKSAAYLVKYMLKGEDHESFRRMSLKPGIGGLAVGTVAAHLAPLLASGVIDDVPPGVRCGERIFPMSRYVRSKVRVGLGRDGTTPASVRAVAQAEYAAEDGSLRERKRLNSYETALCRLAILRSKEKL